MVTQVDNSLLKGFPFGGGGSVAYTSNETITAFGPGPRDLNTSIPSDATDIIVVFNLFSTNGTTIPKIQVGNGAYLTGGGDYNGSVELVGGTGPKNHNAGFELSGQAWAGSNVVRGIMRLTKYNESLDQWVMDWSGSTSNAAAVYVGSGIVDLTSDLDRVRIDIGANFFDGGNIVLGYR